MLYKTWAEIEAKEIKELVASHESLWNALVLFIHQYFEGVSVIKDCAFTGVKKTESRQHYRGNDRVPGQDYSFLWSGRIGDINPTPADLHSVHGGHARYNLAIELEIESFKDNGQISNVYSALRVATWEKQERPTFSNHKGLLFIDKSHLEETVALIEKVLHRQEIYKKVEALSFHGVKS